MLSPGQLSRITLELKLGLAPSNTSEEAMIARASKAEELAQMQRDHVAPDIVFDFFDDDLPPLLRPPAPAITAEEIKLANIRFNLGCSMDLARRFEQEARELADERAACLHEIETRIEAAPLTPTTRAQFLAEIETLVEQGKLWPSKAKWLKKDVRES